jgi:hypothetical protein
LPSNPPPFHALQRVWKCTPPRNHLVKIHKINHVNSRVDQNWGS